jgi:hypothetical protein
MMTAPDGIPPHWLLRGGDDSPLDEACEENGARPWKASGRRLRQVHDLQGPDGRVIAMWQGTGKCNEDGEGGRALGVTPPAALRWRSVAESHPVGARCSNPR